VNFEEFKKKILNTRTILITFLPLFAVFINLFLRYLLGYNYLDGMGYSMSAIAIGELYPFSIFENILIGKLLEFKPIYEIKKGKVIATYNLELTFNKKDEVSNYIEKVKFWTYILCIFCTILFLFSIFYDLKGYKNWSILLGVINVFTVWLYLVFV